MVEGVIASARESLSLLSTPTAGMCVYVQGVHLTACFRVLASRAFPEAGIAVGSLAPPFSPPQCSLWNSWLWVVRIVM